MRRKRKEEGRKWQVTTRTHSVTEPRNLKEKSRQDRERRFHRTEQTTELESLGRGGGNVTPVIAIRASIACFGGATKYISIPIEPQSSFHGIIHPSRSGKLSERRDDDEECRRRPSRHRLELEELKLQLRVR